MEYTNPFALVKASDYTDEQINSLWVEIGLSTINAIIEPQAKSSKFILGGKGTGKTHLLRYFSYPVIRLRKPNSTGLSILSEEKFLAVFLRATGVDASRFVMAGDFLKGSQQLFGIYFELKLIEALLHSLCDIKRTSSSVGFDDLAFIRVINESITDQSFNDVVSVEGFHDWVLNERKKIDEAVNNAAFSGKVDVHIPFSIGSICIPVSRALHAWHPIFKDVPLIYLIDEIENLNEQQQEVLNTLIRYGESNATFRVTGRLYGLKTTKTMGAGEENREGSEYKTIVLDDILRNLDKFPEFAKNFIRKRLHSIGIVDSEFERKLANPSLFFEEIDNTNNYVNAITDLRFEDKIPTTFKYFKDSLRSVEAQEDVDFIYGKLTSGFSLLIQKLNILIFCKKYKKKNSSIDLANEINKSSLDFIKGEDVSSYSTAYNHYSSDLYAQLCRESPKEINCPYAGLDTYIKMSSGNPRNLLLILGKAYSIASFRDIDFLRGPKLSIELQTEAAFEAAKFMFEIDTNLGIDSDMARIAIDRLASLLRTARYALNIPEVSPLAVSFSENDLSPVSRTTLKICLNYSLLFEIHGGRPDRNSQQVNRKFQLNPMLSPRWRLPISRRGDLGLSSILVNAIFDPNEKEAFDHSLKQLHSKWNNPFRKKFGQVEHQDELFDL
ncbi:ORC-CDC6 family AAA ATPase [Methylovorus mays]|uniref:ORC-CDC6 family AAA ATPase n=1 Tax=Methylovorus mays TaxID=184077 RepID=UPI001E60EE21|nr:hypothetical protein [Methylovorus mays]MCB5206702.1 hypothetical protein [Methylovorus mays]